MPSIWEGGTNLSDPANGPDVHAQQDAYGRTSQRAKLQSNGAEPLGALCQTASVTLLIPHGVAGLLTFVPEECASPLKGHEIWTWSADSAWPDEFEIRPDRAPVLAEGDLQSWAFPGVPFDLDDAGPWLRDVETLPEDRLYEVERVSADGAEAIAWFWFQAGDTWNEVAFADASVAALYLSLDDGGFLRFTAIDASELPTWIRVNQAGTW